MPNDNITTTTIRPFVSALIDRFIPEHVRANHPKFVQFIQAYLEFLETSHRSGYFQNTLPEQRSIELQESIFLSRIEKEIGLFVPREYAASPRVFYRKITDLWKAKGSEEGIKLFFRLFLGEIVQIRLPWDNVLKPSDGRWINDNRLRVSMIKGNPENFINKKIIQLENFALAFVTQIEKKEYEDGIIYELSLDINQIVGKFIPGNRIILEDQSTDVEAEIYNSVTDIKILNPGKGYSVGSKIQIKNLSNITFEGRISEVDNLGGIKDIVIVDYGAGSTPNHILDVQTSGFVFRNFVIFDYFIDEIRNQILGDSTGFTETVNLYGQNYTSEFYFGEFFTTKIDVFFSYTDDEEENPYFLENYLQPKIEFSEIGTGFSSESEDSLVNSVINQTENISIRPSDVLGFGEIDIIDQNGINAELVLTFGGIVNKSNYYTGVEGQLSESIVLQDSNFYQKFAYEVVSTLDIKQWIDPLKKTIHPAGIKPFSLIRINNELIPRPEFVLNQISSLLLDPVSPTPISPFSSIFYKFTKVILPNALLLSDPLLEKDFIKPINDFIEIEFDETIEKKFIKGLNELIPIDDSNKFKSFTKTISEKQEYTEDSVPYFAEKYSISIDDLFVSDSLNKKEFIKNITNSVKINDILEKIRSRELTDELIPINDIDPSKKFTKIISTEQEYTEDSVPYFAERYFVSIDDLFVSDLNINKKINKTLNNTVSITESGNIVKFNDFAPGYFFEQYSESSITTF